MRNKSLYISDLDARHPGARALPFFQTKLRRQPLYIFAAIGVILVLLIFLPRFVSNYYVGLLTLMLIYAIFAMSLDILVGYTGMFSLGHSALWGGAAYMVGILDVKVLQSSNFALEMAAGLVFAAILAAFFALLVLRTKGIYFPMLTLALSLTLWGIPFQMRIFAGGGYGIPGISRPVLSFWDLTSDLNYYYFVLIFFIIATVLMYLVTRSPFGHALQGIRESETRMQSLGYNVWLYKFLAFVIGGVFAGLAGILLTYYTTFVGPNQLHILYSFEALLMVILGGPGTLFGPALGAAIITFAKNIISSYTQHWSLVVGIIYILVIAFFPKGIGNLIKTYLRNRSLA
jgi:branched-chain amino acid transport system permease protein